MEWIKVEDSLPKHGVKVFAFFRNSLGKGRRITANYLERWTEESEGEDTCSEYSEKLDSYYLNEGWYETMDCWDEYSSVYCSYKVTHWMELPDEPLSQHNQDLIKSLKTLPEK